MSKNIQYLYLGFFNWLCVIMFLAFNIDIIFGITLLIWLDLFLYSVSKFNERSVLFGFLITFFVFLMGRQTLEVFGMHKIEIEFSADILKKTEIALLLSLLGLFVGYIFGGKYRFFKIKSKIEQKSNLKKQNLIVQYVRKISSVFFHITYPFLILKTLESAIYVSHAGYLSSYISFSSNLPYIVQKLAEISKKNNLLLIVDNTFLSPYFQNPLKLGADVVIHSGTKFLGGHNDTLAGFIVTDREDISEKLRFLIKTTGAGLAPFDSWLILRGIKTLGIRMERAQKNAILLADWLKEQSIVTKVIYPGLPEHPGYEIIKKQARGFGSMITFNVDTKEHALAILKKVRMIKFAESLGGVETLITYPTTQTHADVPEEVREKNGITACTLRLSTGIEDGEDLIAELETVFKNIDETN